MTFLNTFEPPCHEKIDGYIQTVAHTIDRYHMFDPGDTVIIGCSGGADSLCLTHILTSALPQLRLKCIVVYVDHGLRANTEWERDQVAGYAREHGATFQSVRIDVSGRAARTGESIQEAARHLRYDALMKIASQHGAVRIAVGHTRSDQAETVMMQLLRGAGPKGLAGIDPVRGQIVRPLLSLSRSDTENYCREHGLTYVIDPSNTDDAYTRSRVRSELIPVLQAFNPEVEHSLARVADLMREDEVWLGSMVKLAALTMVSQTTRDGETVYVVSIPKLCRSHRGLMRRIIRYVFSLVKGDDKGMTFEHVEHVISHLRHDVSRSATRQIGLFHGVRIVQQYDELLFAREHTDLRMPPLMPQALVVPGHTHLENGRYRVEASFVTQGEKKSGHVKFKRMTALMDAGKLHFPLEVRSRQPGDRIEQNSGGQKKVKDILMDAKVARDLRDAVPVVADKTGVIWVAPYAISARVLPDEETMKLLQIDIIQIE